MSATVKSVRVVSLAELAGIKKGDIILSVNGQNDFDILYYRYLTESESVTLKVQKSDGEIEQFEILNGDFEDLGIVFEKELITSPMRCRNKCIFCFIDQLPKGLRKTLYFKDDDYRLSVLTGNYITLTNLSEQDIDRIIQMRLPRINISVHTVDAKTRGQMLKNTNADVLSIMRRFAKANIAMNCQIVLCRGINDGQRLNDTIWELFSLYPEVQSVSVVPVGLTRYRDGLEKLTPFDESSAKEIIFQIHAIQREIY